MLILICFLSGTVFGIAIFSIPSKNAIGAAITFMFIGVAMIPIMSVAYAFSVELTYPLPEALTNGMMISLSLIWGTIQGVLDAMIEDPRYAMVIWSITSFMGGISAIFIKCILFLLLNLL